MAASRTIKSSTSRSNSSSAILSSRLLFAGRKFMSLASLVVIAFGLCMAQDVGMPLAPKSANMDLIQCRPLAVHAPGGVDPFGTTGAKTQLGGFHGLDVVGMSKTSGSQEA